MSPAGPSLPSHRPSTVFVLIPIRPTADLHLLARVYIIQVNSAAPVGCGCGQGQDVPHARRVEDTRDAPALSRRRRQHTFPLDLLCLNSFGCRDGGEPVFKPSFPLSIPLIHRRLPFQFGIAFPRPVAHFIAAERTADRRSHSDLRTQLRQLSGWRLDSRTCETYLNV